jgi:hypothetical protein
LSDALLSSATTEVRSLPSLSASQSSVDTEPITANDSSCDGKSYHSPLFFSFFLTAVTNSLVKFNIYKIFIDLKQMDFLVLNQYHVQAVMKFM